MKAASIVSGLVLAAVTVWVLGPGAGWILEHVDGVSVGGRTGLTGKDLADALDAIRGRALAVATGVAALTAVFYTARNADTARRTFQLGERGHDTDRYGKAAEQLGHAAAPVRLAGLYALEQLAQNSPALRQTVVDVICAYLRMPYDLDSSQAQEEKQVRLTAQRVLTGHLRCLLPGRRHWWQRRERPPARFWTDIRIDLTGAVLFDLDLSMCRTSQALFTGAAFHGRADFRGAIFFGRASFRGATFHGAADYELAEFHAGSDFVEVAFHKRAAFVEVTFHDRARFESATFDDGVVFSDAVFELRALFTGATVRGGANFRGATLPAGAEFRDSVFFGDASFSQASLLAADFADVVFHRDAQFDEAAVALANFSGTVFREGDPFSEGAATEARRGWQGGRAPTGRSRRWRP
ncbi:pentapeptide repeat-containing protein [Nonomuraea sp. NPDC050556]|uniref:pentapeptide repeat-containing protein n=1 Tax=Nonomuraea sp. NPDC050556 TaxID=3364369 RepID=UPI003790D194